MNGMDLLMAMGAVDDEFYDEALRAKKSRGLIALRRGLMAACVGAALVGGLFAARHLLPPAGNPDEQIELLPSPSAQVYEVITPPRETLPPEAPARPTPAPTPDTAATPGESAPPAAPDPETTPAAPGTPAPATGSAPATSSAPATGGQTGPAPGGSRTTPAPAEESPAPGPETPAPAEETPKPAQAGPTPVPSDPSGDPLLPEIPPEIIQVEPDPETMQMEPMPDYSYPQFSAINKPGQPVEVVIFLPNTAGRPGVELTCEAAGFQILSHISGDYAEEYQLWIPPGAGAVILNIRMTYADGTKAGSTLYALATETGTYLAIDSLQVWQYYYNDLWATGVYSRAELNAALSALWRAPTPVLTNPTATGEPAEAEQPETAPADTVPGGASGEASD